MTYTKHIIATILIAILPLISFAQNGINSPYSRYGFGILADRSMGFNKGMGGVAMGFRDGQSINVANPASYSAVDSLTALFDLGLSLYNANFKMGNLQSNAKNSSFDYFAFHFRAAKGIGIAVGVLPYSNINYNFSSTPKQLGNTENITSSQSFTGEGGLHQVFIGTGVEIFKPLSLGFNLSYLYGSYTHSMSNTFNETNIYSVQRKYTADINTYMVDLGLQYTFEINKKDKITLGAAYSLGHDINDTAIRTTSSTNNGTYSDSITNAFQLPHSLSAGITYSHGTKWNVGADFELQKWNDVKFPTQTDNNDYTATTGTLNDKMKIALGASYTPSDISSNYFNRITYKLGGYYSKSYANADASISTKPYEFGLSAGVTLPISSRHLWYNIPKLNISFQWVHANIPYLSTSHMQQKLKENYLKLCLGLTFSERWFYKWKVQ
jgi:hypothetical protein